MGEVRVRCPVKYIAGLLTGNVALLPEVKRVLAKEVGELDFAGSLLPFNDTNYYQAEFGSNLQRQVVTFKMLRDMDDLASIKRLTNDLEMRWVEDGSRKVNIDPGYIELGKLVLATTKNQSHRIYIGQGIFAEVTLRYRKGSFETWEWTYHDYASRQYLELFNQLRKAYYQQLKDEECEGL